MNQTNNDIMSSDIVGKDGLDAETVIPYLVEVTLSKTSDIDQGDAFLRVRETLTRAGISSSDGSKLYQSCHILHKRGRFYIVHFKTMFILDGRANNLTMQDIARQNEIIRLLIQWGLVAAVNPRMIETPRSMSNLRIIKFADLHKWQLVPKYAIGDHHGPK